jgi:hypothetical protein
MTMRQEGMTTNEKKLYHLALVGIMRRVEGIKPIGKIISDEKSQLLCSRSTRRLTMNSILKGELEATIRVATESTYERELV